MTDREIDDTTDYLLELVADTHPDDLGGAFLLPRAVVRRWLDATPSADASSRALRVARVAYRAAYRSTRTGTREEREGWALAYALRFTAATLERSLVRSSGWPRPGDC